MQPNNTNYTSSTPLATNPAPTAVPDPVVANGSTTPNNTFFKITPPKKSFLAKHSLAILLTGIVVGGGLFAAGILRQVLYQATDVDGRSAEAIQQEIANLDAEITAAATDSGQIFEDTGFSSNFYQSSQSQTNLELEKADLERNLEELTTANSTTNIFNTGAIYFFFAALICLLVTVTIFLVSRRRPQSASIIAP